MKRLVERRTIDKELVRKMCIKDNLYTNGTSAEYDNLLFNLCEEDKTTFDDIENVVADILVHSEWESKVSKYGLSGYDELFVIYVERVINECCYTVVEYEKIQ